MLFEPSIEGFDMAPIRMSLAEAATALGIAPNSVRSRFKAGKLRGERDNSGKIWVWIDPNASPPSPSNLRTSKPSIEGLKNGEIEALKSHIRTLEQQLALSQAEAGTLRDKAALADRLEAQVEGLKILEAEIRSDRDRWRETAERLLTESQKTWWQRLWRNQ